MEDPGILGWAVDITLWYVVAGALAAVLILGFNGAPLWLWMVGIGALLAGYAAPLWLWIIWAALIVLLVIRPVRRTLVSGPLMKLMEAMQVLPAISETEQTAIEAGTVWMDRELFSGRPDFKKILDEAYPELTGKERAFIDGPVEEVCRMVDDWQVYMNKGLPGEVWEYLKKEKFFGLIIDEAYGGLGFSALANSAVVAKVASRCGPLSTNIMVPNSLGPAELLSHYGSRSQCDYYLPRLADGREIPCFALTEPGAGSDASAIGSTGEVFRGEDGTLQLKLNWNKRYITLAAISTVHGLAFKLKDPQNLLGKGVEPGITCALVSSSADGVKLGRRHDPMGIPFYNCPTEGHDVVVPLEEAVIGGSEGVGNGWQMLMESLSAGRGISLPANATGGVKFIKRVIGAYARIRRQFGLPIGKFEGIQEPMARIGGYTYLMEAARRYTCGGLDSGAKPAVITAVAKYQFTELSREALNDGMDIMGGAGISRGPRNLLAHGYMGMPISITVEGANILTRSLIIFGQGAIRCHPYAYPVIKALMDRDRAAFDQAFFGHMGHVVRNQFRALLLSLSRGHLADVPAVGRPARRYYRKMAWASASFAFLADVAMGSYGGALKKKEQISGRFADILSWMYLGVATLRRFEAEGRHEEDEIYLQWAMETCFARIQEAFTDILRNIEVPLAGPLFRGPIALWSSLNSIGNGPSDRLNIAVAEAMQQPGEQRDRLTEGIYLPDDASEALGHLEYTLELIVKAEPIEARIRKAEKKGELKDATAKQPAQRALEKGVISQQEADLLKQAHEVRMDAIQVDSFTLEEYDEQMPRPVSRITAG